MVSHQSDLLYGGLSLMWSIIVFQKCGFSSRWSLISVIFLQGCLSSVWSVIKVVFNQCGLPSMWSLISAVYFLKKEIANAGKANHECSF